jgi:hypothetical protein
MKWIKKYLLFSESSKDEFKPIVTNDLIGKKKYNYKNLISEICISMILLNNDFLDNLLDRGLKAKYTENSDVFLTDLKGLVLGKNRLEVGIFNGDVCEVDPDASKISYMFDNIDFSIEKDWNLLIDSRVIARNIIDKILLDKKLTQDMISKIYWIGPNKDKDHQEDFVIELESGDLMSVYINKGFLNSKTSSFSNFCSYIIGEENIDKMYSEDYIFKWNDLAQKWVKIIYENSNKNIKLHILKFISEEKMDILGYFEYFDIKNKDPKFKSVGEYIKELDKNILTLPELLSEIWKRRDEFFTDSKRVYEEWSDIKSSILNSKIIEHLFTDHLMKNNRDDIKKLPDGFKQAKGKLKMKIVKMVIEKLGINERDSYYFYNKGNNFYKIPSRQFFRKFYNDLVVKFDYHTSRLYDLKSDSKNDFVSKFKVDMHNSPFINFDVLVKFSGGEMLNKFSCKFSFDLPDDFNSKVSGKNEIFENED